MAGGRPSTFTSELAQAICELLADGKTLTQIGLISDMPDRRTIQRWKLDSAEFCRRCQRAQELGAEAMVDQCLSIADESSRDTYFDDDGNERANTEVVARSKLRVDTRMRIAAILNSRMTPKNATQHVTLDARVSVTEMSDEDLLAIAQGSINK